MVHFQMNALLDKSQSDDPDLRCVVPVLARLT
jgi:hypothetical protein